MQTTTRLPLASFAPPLTAEIIDDYETLAQGLTEPSQAEIRDILLRCLACVKAWWDLPESTLSGDKFDMSYQGFSAPVEIKPMEKDHIQAIWDVTPFPGTAEYWQSVIEKLPTGVETNGYQPIIGSDGVQRMIESTRIVDAEAKKLRDIAFHLIWHVRELALDREPTTQDKLPPKI